MEKYYFSDFVHCDGDYADDLQRLQKRYPASSFLNVFLLKSHQHGTVPRSQREKMLLTVINRDVLEEVVLDIEHAVETRETPLLNVQHSNFRKNGDLNPIFVKHPQANSGDKHALIDQLIKKFSKDAPKIIYSPETHDADADYGVESSIEDRSIVSVSLADIYAEQGYYERAIQMYEILKLHFPEKNSIFAARIEELKLKLQES